MSVQLLTAGSNTCKSLKSSANFREWLAELADFSEWLSELAQIALNINVEKGYKHFILIVPDIQIVRLIWRNYS